ncbi:MULTISPECIES: amino acid ABC transporter permease [unclassified Streptomyces]|uniref:amino acid ABC transporter permease n=1 Tax=unclassified Streptomyces TaxID=2593676 RepID=UPI0011E63AC4|nr:amino acid ABC transporter permease [Streptomyces sp. sk2.1]TXS67260.1 amino acid ABC transporter permease [Streptomyces sp. sk2.1]
MTDKFDKVPGGPSPVAAPVSKASSAAPEAIRAVPVRHYGRWVSGIVVFALLAALVYAFSQGNIQWQAVRDKVFDETVLAGASRTLLISVLAMVLGVALGVVLAVMRLSKNPVTSWVAWLYIWFFRGTPVYVQLLLWFNLALIFPILNIPFIYKDEMTDVMTPFMCALLGLGLNEAAYMAEICRAGIQSVDEGQTEASHALGMTQAKTMRRVVLPQALRVIIPPTGNEFINMLKTSSLVYAVTYNELLRSTSQIGSTSYAVMEMLFVASIWYIVMTSVFSVGQYYLERRYARGSLRSLPPTPWQRVRANLASFSNRRTGGASA